MATQNLLVELFVEELPPKALKKLGDAFATTLADSLKVQGLASADAAVISFATPRRLAVHIAEVEAQAADKAVTQKLMPVSIGLDANGNATPALIKRLNALGADESAVSQLKKSMDGKAEALFLDQNIHGASLADGLQIAVDEAISKLPIPKVMSYQLADGWSSVNFVRPAHGLVAIHGADVVSVHALGLASSNVTQGHRFEAAEHLIPINNADSYAEQMREQGAVIASFDARQEEIKTQLAAAAAKETLTPIDDAALLDEVTALVELPKVLLGQFESEYLEVPQECLILTMKANQKYFPLLDATGKLTNKFLIVSNINPADASAVIGGNERVVRPRLADAKFFFDQDRKKTLESRLPGLDKVVYHNKLGTQGERTKRVRAIAKAIGQQLGGEKLAEQADKAAMLAKADLLTDMVGEFPELQGTMGAYYAKHDGLSTEIAQAIEDHYKPRFSGDELPRNDVGICVALADKLETLVGLFSIGEKPTGDKDPFGLRRHALGIVRILAEFKVNIDLLEIVKFSATKFANYDGLNTTTINDLHNFVLERVRSYLREPNMPDPSVPVEKTPGGGIIRAIESEMGFSLPQIESVICQMPTRIDLIKPRMDAVRDFSELLEAESLVAANKRVGNILKKAEGKIQDKVNDKLLKEPAEIALNTALVTVKPKADAAFESGDYTASLQALAALKDPVDAFFDSVMVNAEDKDLRNNRLALLAQLHAAMNRVADISKLAT
jgi:glycyl-tRNA synthetase beta chain